MLSTPVDSGIKTALVFRSPSGKDGEDLQPLEMDLVGEVSFSIFRLSRVSDCLVTSNLAEVKVFLLSSLPLGRGSAV